MNPQFEYSCEDFATLRVGKVIPGLHSKVRTENVLLIDFLKVFFF